MAQIISILNYKGGVAKTTTAINLGTALWILGKKVLLIDTDAQCNLTGTLGFDATEGDNTLYEWLKDDEINPPVYQRYEGLNFIPASRKLLDIESYLMNKRSRETILSKRLKSIENYFDYIIIDCSPKEGVLNDNSMTASSGVIVPVECSSYSMQGMQGIVYSVNDVKSNLNEELDLLGLVIVKYDKGTKIAREAAKYLEREFKDKLYNTRIRKCVRFDESPMNKQSIFEFAPDSNGAEDYIKLAEEISGAKRKKNWQSLAVKAFEKNQEE